MIEVIVLLIVGMLIGYLLRRKKKVLKINRTLTSLSIYALLFVLGASLGSDSQLLEKLPSIGLHSIILSVLGIGGSVALAALLYHKVFKHKIG